MDLSRDTIAAISTAVSEAGIGIVRISGPKAESITDKIVRNRDRSGFVASMDSHTIRHGYLFDDEKIIDEVLVSVMKAPHSYTGETVVEINCHGGVLILRRALELVISGGARIAQPGEFSKRAFLNGKLDLSQAEAVMDIISAGSDKALKASAGQLTGSLSAKISKMRDKILHDCAFIESAVDDPEHFDIDGFRDELRSDIEAILKEAKELSDSFKEGRLLREGIKTVLIGPPNSGKSSVLNLLTGEDRAIVTDIAGTTRDTLEEYISFGEVGLRIIDTAGIRSTKDAIENIGIDRSKKAADEADLIIYIIDGASVLPEDIDDIFGLARDKESIILLNKSDLECRTGIEDIKNRLREISVDIKDIIEFSALKGNGTIELKEAIRDKFFNEGLSSSSETIITRNRHKESIDSAIDFLLKTMQSIDDDMSEEFYTPDLMGAYTMLGKIIGESVEDDLVDRIFSEFCMGK